MTCVGLGTFTASPDCRLIAYTFLQSGWTGRLLLFVLGTFQVVKLH